MANDQQTIEQLEADVKRNTRITTVLLAAFIIQAVVFMFIAYQRVQAMTDPERLADLGEEYLEENYQEVRKLMKEQIKKAAPAIARELSEEARQSLPEARARLERLLVREFEQGVAAGTEFSADKFRELLKDNRDTIVQVLQEVKELPKETEQAVIALEKAIEKQLQFDIQKQADSVLAFHKAINKKLETLTSDRSLEPQELLEQRILRIARTIQLREMKSETSAKTALK
jgi:hypothetical protein